MKGSEKQIAWAEDLKVKAINALEWARMNPVEEAKAIPEQWNQLIDQLEARIDTAAHASYIIDAFRSINFARLANDEAAGYVCGAMSGRYGPCKF